MNTHDMLPFVWPLCAVLVALFILRQIGNDVRPILKGVLGGIPEHAQKHAMFYAIVIGFGLQAFGTGFYDNFWPIEPADMAKLGWWQVVAALLKSMSFAIGIMVGYALKGPQADAKTPPDTGTTPPATPSPPASP